MLTSLLLRVYVGAATFSTVTLGIVTFYLLAQSIAIFNMITLNIT